MVAGDCRTVHSDPQQEIAPHVCATQLGDVLFIHAGAINTGLIQVGKGEQRMALMLFRGGCQCGCNAPGKGIVATPDVNSAREIASWLLATADRIEAEAATAADAAIAAARRPRA